MRNRKKRLLLLLIFLLVLSGCGGKEGENKGREIIGILPTRIEQIDQGGVIPEGHEAKVQAQSEYTLDMLWGTWVRKGSTTEEIEASEQTISIGSKEEPKEIECFPAHMSLNPAWAGIYDGLSGGRRGAEAERVAEENYYVDLTSEYSFGGFSLYEEPEEDLFGKALEKYGYGFGVADFQEAVDEDDPYKILSFEMGYGDKIAYAIHENTLAIGVTGEGSDESSSELDIVEIDYEMSLKGYELELTYNGETAVYVPEQIEGTIIYQGFDMNKAGVTDGYEEIDKIKGISLVADGDDSSGMMTNLHEGYVESSFDFGEDGLVTISSSKGDTYQYKYYYSGDSLTLISENQVAVYSLYDYMLESQNATPTYGFYAAGNSMDVYGGWTPVNLIKNGFSTPVDMNQPMASCQVSDEIIFTYQGAKMTVKAVNIYDEPVPLSECIICYYCIDDKSGIITKGDGSEFGVTTLETIDYLYAPYEKTEATLKYKGEQQGIVAINPITWGGPMHILDNSGFEVIYHFKDDILDYITIEDPALLYNGLHDNVESSLLAQLEPSEFQGVIQVRDTIMDRLRTAFAEAGIQVDINEKTGEILMDNDILFNVDKYDLTSAGQQYIDSFMGVYASVITAEEFSDYISDVYFEGHTDSSGSYGYNLTLSQKRAETVLDYCVNSTSSGLDSAQKTKLQQLSTAIGYSSSDLVYDDKGKEDMDASRRVAIKFFINVEDAGTALPAVQDDTATQQEDTVGIPQTQTAVTEENTAEQENGTSSEPDLDMYFSLLGGASILLMHEDAKVPFTWELPMQVQMVLNEGWTSTMGAEESLEPGFYNRIFEKDGAVLCVSVENPSSSALPIEECTVIAMEITDDDGLYVGLKGGIDFDSTENEIINVYGTPDFTHTEEGYTFMSYTRDSGTVHFAEGPMDGIFLLAPGYSFNEDNVFYTNLKNNNNQ